VVSRVAKTFAQPQTSRAGLQLLLFARTAFLKDYKAPRIALASIGSGPLFLPNKGALAIRLDLTPTSSAASNKRLVFLTAHYTPHLQNTARRNLDWENTVRRLVFEDGRQVYDADHLFVYVKVL
jgi:hypothetical protein